jgi:hypothetical protein
VKRLIIGIVLCLGCGPMNEPPPPPVSLADLVSKRDAVVLSVDVEHGSLTLDYNPFSGGCVTLAADLDAGVNGEPLHLISLGAGTVTDEPDIDSCTRPSWTFDPRDAGEATTTFALSDGTTTVSAQFIQLAAPRTMDTPDASVGAYQTIEVNWSPATDNIFWGPQNADSPVAYALPTDGSPSLGPLQITRWTSNTSFTVQVPGLYQRQFDLVLYGAIERGVAECTPANITCSARSRVGYLQQLDPTLRLTAQ